MARCRRPILTHLARVKITREKKEKRKWNRFIECPFRTSQCGGVQIEKSWNVTKVGKRRKKTQTESVDNRVRSEPEFLPKIDIFYARLDRSISNGFNILKFMCNFNFREYLHIYIHIYTHRCIYSSFGRVAGRTGEGES